MSISFHCDGCGKPVENPEKVGHVTQREYCPGCKEIAEQFVSQEEALREAMQTRFIDDRALLIAKFSEGGFKLPDVR